MTIYEQIQNALDRIETTLDSTRRDEAAREAGMSVRSFQHYFWAVMRRLLGRSRGCFTSPPTSSDKAAFDGRA